MHAHRDLVLTSSTNKDATDEFAELLKNRSEPLANALSINEGTLGQRRDVRVHANTLVSKYNACALITVAATTRRTSSWWTDSIRDGEVE